MSPIFLRRILTAGLLSIIPLTGSWSSQPVLAFGQQSHRLGGSQSAREIIADVIKTYGGAEKIKLHKTIPLRSKGVISSNSGISTASNSYQCQIFQRGDKLRIEMSMLGVPLTIGYDGTTSWSKYGDWVSANPKSTSQVLAEDSKHGLPALQDALEPDAKLELLSRQEISGKSCDVVKITANNGTATIFFIDPTNNLILRSEYPGTDYELGIKAPQVIEYFDYRPVAGSLEPFHFIQYSGTKKKSETVLSSIEADPELNETIFAMPPESEFARLKDGPITIPFEYAGNEIFIRVRMNIGQEAKFIVDTGASQSVIDKRTAASFGTNPISTFAITAGSKALPLTYTKIPSLGIGDLTLSDVPMLITDLSNVSEHPSGLIGANILRRFLVTIDYDEKKLTLADPRSAAVPADSITIPTAPVFGATALVIKGQIDNKTTMNFLVDTGASFNNLPQSLAKPFYGKTILPVGQIYGLDGQKLAIGSIRLKSLKLGPITIPSPIFTIAPDNTTGGTGLFNTGIMGILGNPIWSQFKTTIDYRNERIVLQAPAEHDKFVILLEQLESADREYLKKKEPDDAVKAYEKILTKAEQNHLKGIQALATAGIAGCYADKFAKTKESHWYDVAGREYERAEKIASESRQSTIDGEILARWSLMYLNAMRSNDDIKASQILLNKALTKAPMNATVYAAFGASLIHTGKISEAEKLIDHALVLDPANWQALWTKYKLCQESGRTQDQQLVATQLQYYFPDFPDVIAISSSRKAY